MPASVNRNPSRAWPALALLPMLLAVPGAALDERWHLGFSTWRSACRAAGLSLPSLFTFTLQLLPTAVMGALIGGAVLQIVGICLRHRRGVATASLSAHGACILVMAVTLPLCALALPVSWLLGAELLLTLLAAALLNRLLGGGTSCAASGAALIRRLPSA